MMNDATIHALSLKDDLFAKFGDDFDNILADIVRNMNEQQVEEAEITAKMTIKLDLVETPNPSAANINGYRDALMPTIKHAIASTIKIKNEKKGCIPEGYELVMDPSTGKFVLVKVSNGQASMFDTDDVPPTPRTVDVDAEVREADEAPAALPEPQHLLNPAEATDEEAESDDSIGLNFGDGFDPDDEEEA